MMESTTRAPRTSRRAALHTGRVNQKRRTQQALMAAALALRDEGRQPTLQDVADRALVSRATAYRYFASMDTLMAMAQFERAMPALEEVFRRGDDPVRALGRAAERINGLLLDDERAAHALLRGAMQDWLDSPAGARPPRPGRRMQLIDPIVAACAGRLDAAARRRLRGALALVIGAEAVVSLRDVAGVPVAQALAISRWAAETLVRAALARRSR
jgi:AcrR family transcriptional regulator